MPTTFSQSLRALNADSFRFSTLGIGLSALVLIGCGLWFAFARVTVHAVSDEMRLEVAGSVHRLMPRVDGLVIGVHDLQPGREVEQGEVLVELESESERLLIEKNRTQLVALPAQIETIVHEIEAIERLAETESVSGAHLITEAQARQREAAAASNYATGNLERTREILEETLGRTSDMSRHQSIADQAKALATAREVAVERSAVDLKVRQLEHESAVANLRSKLVILEGELATAQATDKQLHHQVELRSLRSPVDGVLGEAADLRPGAFVETTDLIATVLPNQELRAVAYYSPLAAVGRIQADQAAKLRMDGFPWAQYGAVSATVLRTAKESRDDRIRVELALEPGSAPLIPLKHGMPGTVEITVEQVTPASLVLRAVGRLLTGKSGR